ncbi:hypothetical protein AURANDRAFT_65041 [Aureococcus anophagefferens]|jgi:hypothetical protein|uniref:Uncharacterized protein n=1 Tax=Aureococcus anophagefferens TaxID=44056 RepID=F0YBS9_AURAN|nr:hypothetical protein AURANDRAFT_65041 [Aureococcus anophagefferens]EGB07330.1 hypothetical protein AURANDRAFT_65041 [Aureococcus anophagefferens]|eukprot:XP_009037957.1 hypothetical protein AURANDRAFT_65041 [Aureococcus anophagefferens]
MRRALLLALAAACATHGLERPRRRRALAPRGGAAAAHAVAKDFNWDGERTWVDRTIAFLEAPMTELAIGTMAVGLTFVEIGREINRLGSVREANWALLFLAMARLLKSLLAVLRSTRMALRGYKSYRVVRRGDNVYLKHLPPPDDPQHTDDKT